MVRLEGEFAVTDAEREVSPPSPVQLRAYVAVPTDGGVTVREPLSVSGPDQSLSFGLAVAVQEVALTLDHVSVVDCPTVIGLGEAEIVTVGGAGLAVIGAERDVFPPSPAQLSV
jgi:hypothetical protein